MKKKLTLLFALLCASVMGWAEQYCERVVTTTIDYTSLDVTVTVKKQDANTVRVILDNEHITGIRAGGTFQQWGNGVWQNQDDAVANFAQGWTPDGNAWYKDFVFSTYPTTGNFQIYILMDHNAGNPPVAGFTLTNIDIDNDCSGGGSTPDPDPDPAVTGVCSTETYNSNVAGYDIHAKVTKGCNKYYLTISSATEGKTITGLVGDNMFCNRYCDEARTHNNNYHMAAAGHYTLTDGKVIFTIPSVGDPKMYTPLNLKFSDNQTVEVSALNGLRLEPCSSEAAAECPDPEPTEIQDVNFALINNGAIAYASNGNAWEAIDGNDGSRWESSFSDPQWFIVDLGQRRIFNTVQIRWQTAYSRTFTIDVSNDGETWTTKKVESNYTGGGENVEYEVSFGENVTARYVRLSSTARATEWGNSFYSFRVLLKGTPVLTSVGLAANTTIAKIGEYATLTPSPKDQNNGPIAANLTYTVTPADAGHVTDNKYYPDKYGMAIITVTASAAEVEVTSNSIFVYGVLSDNLALSADIPNSKVIAQSEVTGNATDAFYAVDGNTGSVWQACRDLVDNQSNAYFTSYFTLDLGNSYAINLIAIWFDGAASDEYTIEFSANNVDWATGFSISQHVGNYTHQKYLSTADLNNNDLVRYVRFTTTKASTTNGWGMKMFEMKVYGTEASTTKTVSASVGPDATGSVTITAGGNPVTEVESGTQVTFTATPASGYDFVNWTKGGEVVSTEAEYSTTITSNTALVANFELHRDVYCRTEVLTNDGKTLYLSCSQVMPGFYRIRVDGSNNAKINSKGNFNFEVNHTTDFSNGEYDEITGRGWFVSNEGNGYAQNTFAAADYKAITFGSHYLFFNAQGGGNFTLDTNFPAANTIAWNESCMDAAAPIMATPIAAVLNTTDVRLTLSATDNWGGTITYNINYKPTGDSGDGVNVDATGASGETITKDIEGLTTGIEYTFTITASDGTNVSAAQACTATPAGDVAAPTNVTISAVALTDQIVRLTLSADDDYAGDITYNIAYDNAGEASTSAAQGTTTTLDITGLTPNTEYHFSVTAKDAANNTSAAVNAAAVRTFAANLALHKDCEAGYIALPKAESNDGNKGSRWASGGSAVHGDDISTSQDWWYVDLGAVYDIKNIRMFWEGARPSKYKFFTSNDAIAWTEVANLLVSPSYSANASAVMDYLSDINADAQGRYVKVWGYEDTNNNWAYGISFWELEVYGTPAADGVAPVINSFTATGASSTSVLLKATADDNFKGDLTYTFYCNDVAQGEPVVKASGIEATCTVTGLTMGTNYNFKVNVSDGTNNTMSDVVVGTPISDNQAPTNVTVSTKSKSDEKIVLTLSATDNLGGVIYYTVTCGETVKNAEALSGDEIDVIFDGLDYNTPYAFSVVAKDGSDNAATAVAHNETTLPASYPTSAAPAPEFEEASVRPVFSSAYNKDCNFNAWGGSPIEKQTYGAKKLNYGAAYFGIVDFGTIKVNADDELYLSVWTNENIKFRVVPIIHNATEDGNLPERGAFTQTLTGGQWNVVHFTMSDFVLNDGDVVVEPNENYERIYQIKIDRAANQTFWLDNIFFRRNPDLTRDDSWMAPGELGTICIPNGAVATGGDIYELKGKNSDGKIVFATVTNNEMEPGKPYLFEAKSNAMRFYYTSATPAGEPDNSGAMKGTFEAQTLTGAQLNNVYYFAGHALWSCVDLTESGLSVPANRAWVVLDENMPAISTSNPAPGRRYIYMGVNGQNATTGFGEVQGDELQSTKMLINGHLFIRRGEKTYDATGRLVK